MAGVMARPTVEAMPPSATGRTELRGDGPELARGELASELELERLTRSIQHCRGGHQRTHGVLTQQLLVEEGQGKALEIALGLLGIWTDQPARKLARGGQKGQVSGPIEDSEHAGCLHHVGVGDQLLGDRWSENILRS